MRGLLAAGLALAVAQSAVAQAPPVPPAPRAAGPADPALRRPPDRAAPVPRRPVSRTEVTPGDNAEARAVQERRQRRWDGEARRASRSICAGCEARGGAPYRPRRPAELTLDDEVSRAVPEVAIEREP